MNKLSTTALGGHRRPDVIAPAGVADADGCGVARAVDRDGDKDREMPGMPGTPGPVLAKDPVYEETVSEGRRGTAVPTALTGSTPDDPDGPGLAPPPEKAQASAPRRPRPSARVITRRRQ